MAKNKKIPSIVKAIRNKPIRPINFAFDKVISYSQASMYESCPKKWALKYKEKIRPPDQNINLLFGICIHEVIQEYLEEMYNNTVVSADSMDLISMLQSKFSEQYKKLYKKNQSTHFTDPVEMHEFFTDGSLILKEFKSKRGKYFNKRGWFLVGCETPISILPDKIKKNITFRGYLDVVLYHEPTNTIEIIDLKTSTRGWRPKFEKKDELKNLQLVVYKKYLSDIFGFELKNIKIKYLILKRKLYDNIDFPQSRLQEHSPSDGRNTIMKAEKLVTNFINEAFDENSKIKDKKFEAKPSKWNCAFCPYSEDLKTCGQGLRFK